MAKKTKKTTIVQVTLTQEFSVEAGSIEELNKAVENTIKELIETGQGIDYEWDDEEETTI